MDETGAWKKFLENRGVATDPAIRRYIINLEKGWDERTARPSRIVFADLIKGGDAGSAMDMLEELKALDVKDVTAKVEKLVSWLSTRGDKKQNAAIKALNFEDELSKFLVGNDIVEEADVTPLISKVVDAKVTSMILFKASTKEDLIDMGFSRVQANAVVLAIKAEKKRQKK